jgi:hypothetical protein
MITPFPSYPSRRAFRGTIVDLLHSNRLRLQAFPRTIQPAITAEPRRYVATVTDQSALITSGTVFLATFLIEPRESTKPSCCTTARDPRTCSAETKLHADKANSFTSVNNVTGLDERLGSMEKALRQLSDIVKEDKQSCVSSDGAEVGSRGKKRVTDFPDNVICGKTGVVKRADVALSDGFSAQFRGCSLLSLCNEIRDVINEVQRQEGFDELAPVGGGASIKVLSSELSECISPNDYLEIAHDGAAIILPPRQLLSMACVPFFQTQDLATDLFCKKIFWENVDRVYSQPFTAQDNAWAVCFDLIIILGLSVDQSDVSSAEFLRPFLLNVIRAYASTSIFLRLELINVQALALLVGHTQSYLRLLLPVLN